MSLDFFILQKLNWLVFQNRYFDLSVIFFAKYLAYVLVIVAGLLVLLKRKKLFAFAVVLSPTLASLATLFLRLLHQRQRPFYNDSVNLLFAHSESAAFPSLHSSFFFALSTAVLLYNKKAGVCFFIASSFMILARVIAGLHWPGDVLFGAGLGILCGLLVNLVVKKYTIKGGE